MVVDPNDIVPFFVWLVGGIAGALWTWLLVVACVAIAATVIGWLVAALHHGPGPATWTTGRVLRDTVLDLVHLSPRRTWALAWLAIQESIRRRVVVVFAVFIVVLLFAGWFLDPGSAEPARLYLDFVLTATSYLVLLLALFLSALSLPADLKNRTLYTVVTKPVRASEIVLGRIVGFMAVGTLLLAIMGVISYVFVERGLAHTHELTADDLHPAEGSVAGKAKVLHGKTSRVNQHSHEATIDVADRKGRLELEQGHQHALTVATEGAKTVYRVGPAEGMLLARVPVYGKLTFRDRTGDVREKGSNVGDEWAYRGFIEGGTHAACVWNFEGITKEAFPKGLPVQLSLEAFRTHKGNIEKRLFGSLSLRKPGTDAKPERVHIFQSKEFMIDEQFLPREIVKSDGKKVDLFEEFVNDGQLEVWLQCMDAGQYFGAAQADLYLSARNASFALNFVKGYIGIWLQMLLVTALGVMFSTFLSGPIAMLATLGALLGGFFNDFMFRLSTGQTYGGGPFESMIRMWTQQNQTSPMEQGLRTSVALALDQAAEACLWVMSHILPDFGRFNFANYVASGFDISGDTILTYTCRAFAFVLPVFVAAYLCLKNKEVGK